MDGAQHPKKTHGRYLRVWSWPTNGHRTSARMFPSAWTSIREITRQNSHTTREDSEETIQLEDKTGKTSQNKARQHKTRRTKNATNNYGRRQQQDRKYKKSQAKTSNHKKQDKQDKKTARQDNHKARQKRKAKTRKDKIRQKTSQTWV
jgi:hypothetical protein